MKHFILLVIFARLCNAVDLTIVEKAIQKPLDGRICGFGDMNKDRYTDLIVQNQDSMVLKIYIQTESGRFNPSDFAPIKFNVGSAPVVCAVADFNGDALPDIMVTSDTLLATGKKVDIFLNTGKSFTQQHANIDTLLQPPNVVDLNGDGIADLVGFLENYEFFCLQFNSSGAGTRCEETSFPGYEQIKNPFAKFAHIFTDINGDLGSEIIFALEGDKKDHLVFQTWQLKSIVGHVGEWNRKDELIKEIPSTGLSVEHYGSGVVADFDGDGLIDILVPICRDSACHIVDIIMIYSPRNGWVYFQLDLKDSELIPGDDGTVFRVGDFTLDGYPDLIATIIKGDKIMPMVFENVDYNGNLNFSRKFEMMGPPKNSAFVIPEDVTNGKIVMSSFFDLKEDGSLDILLEYTDYRRRLKFDFIRCDDKGDTTFLKVQIFTNVCTKNCKNAKSDEIGSGISWHGSCATYQMPDTAGRTQISAQCLIPQTGQRLLHSPFLLFGLGRSPNFIDELKLGSPRVPDNAGNQQHILKQIVPNSRIVVVPPEGSGTHWLSRLYLTASQLIIQSVAVLCSVCFILVVLIMVLHYQEKKQDRKERQAQLNRFHFDAM